MISIATLIAAGIAPTQARAWADPLAAAAARFGINTPVQQAAWVSQCAHESGSFVHIEEDLHYRRAEQIRAVFPSRVHSLDDAARLVGKPEDLANCVYANKNGNGDEASGDGFRYRGRGLIQLTGRSNYMAAEIGLGQPYKSQPDLLLQPMHAAMTAAWFFASHGCLPLADASNVEAITKVINGGTLGLDERRQRFEEAVRAFA